MKKTLKLIPFALIIPTLGFISLNKANSGAYAAAVYTKSSLPTTIDLNDCTDTEIREYYSALNSKADADKQGQNLLKALKPILINNQRYYDYVSGDIVWKMYEITDRDWAKSPASTMTQGTYDSTTNTITGYSYGSNSNQKDNPYVKSYYMDYTQENQVRAWGNHTQDGYGINREHLWAKSEGFDDDSSGAGARGDPMHLVAANGWANNQHNNNYFGYVDTTKEYTDTSTKYSSVGHNLLGPSKTHPLDGVVVFEPQDADKGDIARAMFYMVARYNNLAGDDTTIGGANPNLALTNDLSTWKKNGYTSTGTTQGFMGVLDDLLEWNELDPVDDYEIHRNNILFKNFTNNRNPFIDFPEWANIIWGGASKVANPQSDPLNGGNPNTISDFVIADINYGGTPAPSATAISGDVSFAYSRNETGPFTSTVPTEAGIWYVQATSVAVGDYSADAVVKSFRIIGDPNTISDFVINDIKVGETPTPSATAVEGTVTYTYSDKETGPFTDTVPTTAGTYYVKATSINKDNLESTSVVKQFKITEPTAVDKIKDKVDSLKDENGKIFGLEPIIFYCIVAVVAIIVIALVIFIFVKMSKSKKKKVGKKVAKELGIPVPKTTSSSSGKSTTKKSTSSKSSSSKSSSSKSGGSKSSTKKK